MSIAASIANVLVALAVEGLAAAAYEIRRRVYCHEVGKLTPEGVIDDYDNRAVRFVAGIDGEWVSSARMVFGEAAFEMEKYFDLSEFRKQGSCAEINRFAVLPDYRRSVVAYGMFRGFYRYAIKNRIRFFCIVTTPENCRMYRHMGFKKIGGPIYYEEVHCDHDADVLDLDQALDEWRENRPSILEQFLKPIEGIG